MSIHIRRSINAKVRSSTFLRLEMPMSLGSYHSEALQRAACRQTSLKRYRIAIVPQQHERLLIKPFLVCVERVHGAQV